MKLLITRFDPETGRLDGLMAAEDAEEKRLLKGVFENYTGGEPGKFSVWVASDNQEKSIKVDDLPVITFMVEHGR